jgi:hypothetical protein
MTFIDASLTNTSLELEYLITNIPIQLIIEDIFDLVFDSIKKLSHCHTRGIPKPIYEPKLFNKVKYHMSHYVSNHIFLKFIN